jgi:twitching motility protein PilI
MDADQNPIAQLREFDLRFRALGQQLPGGAMEQGTMWRGIGFRVGGEQLVAGMDQVREVLTDPQISRVPGAKNWVRGLANVRGRLVTIVDLSDFLGIPRAQRLRGTRALYIEHGDLQVGLMVDDVFGAKQLPEDERTEELGNVSGVLRPYLSARFAAQTENWGVFDVMRVLSDPEFLNAAA